MSKVLLLHFPGADWHRLQAMTAEGALPAFAGLMERGRGGSLKCVLPTRPATAAATLLTGQRPFNHQILGRVAVEGDTVRPVSSQSLGADNLLRAASRQGRQVHAVGWPCTGGDALTGMTVDDGFWRAPPSGAESDWPIPPGSVIPESLADEIADMRVHPEELPGDAIRSFAPLADKVDQRDDPKLSLLAAMIAESVSLHAVVTWILENRDWDFAAFHYPGLERISQAFARYEPPQLATTSDRDLAIYGGAMAQAYRFHDLLLGRLLELAGDEGTVILVSGYGYKAGEARPVKSPPTQLGEETWRRSAGMALLSGPDVASGKPLAGASVLDVAPTVRALLSLPSQTDLEGTSWVGAGPCPPADQWSAPLPQREPAAVRLGEPDTATLLRRLGHLNQNTPPAAALRACRQDILYARARSLLQARRFDAAIQALEQLAAESPDDLDFSSMLAQAYLEARRLDECRRVVDGLRARNIETPLLNVALATLSFAERDMKATLAYLDKASTMDNVTAGVHALKGQVFARLRRWGDAETAFDGALQMDPNNATALDGMALVRLAGKHYEAAMDWADRALQAADHLPMPHYRRGIALERLNRPREAIDAFEAALKAAPNLTAAHVRLSQLYRHTFGDMAKALTHDTAARYACTLKIDLPGASRSG